MARARNMPPPHAPEAPVIRRHAPDYGVFAVVAVLVVFGLIAVYSSSYALGVVEFDDANHYLKRQAFWGAVGFLGLLVVMNIDYRILKRLSPILMLGAIVTLGLVLVPGLSVEQNGAQSWLAIGPVVGQPSEFAKLAVLVYMSAWLAAKGKAVVQDFTMGVLPFIGMVGLVIGLILVQPDLGTAVMIAIITGALFWVAGARLVHVLTLAGTTAAAAGVLIVSAGYRMDRIFAFTSAESDPMGVGFHTLQLLVAFGSGGLTGLGLGVSRQKFFYVFGAHTDGVLAIMGEELGFVGVMVVLALFLLLIWRGVVIAKRAPDAFGSLLATGIVAWIGFQMLMNVGGVTRLIPLTGIPLPFVSYGGSALAATLIAVGLLLSISRYAVFKKPVPETPQRGAVPTRPLARDRAPAAQGGSR